MSATEYTEEKKEVYTTNTAAVGEGSFTDLSDIVQESTSEEIAYLQLVLGHDAAHDMDTDEKDFQIILKGAQTLSFAESHDIVTEALAEHLNDRNFPNDLRIHMNEALEADNDKCNVMEGVSSEYALRAIASIFYYSSPYPEVRASTQNWDDPDEYCETIRVYIVGLIWTAIAAFVDQFFWVRQPRIILSSSLLQLFTAPSGWLLAHILPDWSFKVFGTKVRLNPGPWSYKEQTLVTIMYGMSAGTAYVDSQILVQKLPKFYDNAWATAGYQILMLLSTQYLGFGLVGFFRNSLVYPTQNLFMQNFPTLALNRAILSPDNRNPVHGWKLTRWHFFGLVFVGIFLYEWIPLYLMSFLAYFNWMTWIAPNNYNLATITGSVSGIGLNPISTFDWTTISNFNPLYTPFFAYSNLLIGAMLAAFTILGISYSNMYNTGYLPINSNALFTNTGESYVVKEILTDNVLDEAKYQAYSPPYYTAANLVSYGSFFASYTSVYVSTLLDDWRALLDSFKDLALSLIGRSKSVKEYKDAHSRMMAKHAETPAWWFLVILAISFGMAVATFKAFPTDAPIWGLFLALGMSIIFIVPIGILQSRTANTISINVLVELIVGYAKPGYGTALMLIKAFGVNTQIQANSFLADLKMGHYAKIPPRASFRVQVIGTLVQTFITFAVCQFQLYNVKDICMPSQKLTTKFTCPNETTYFSSSVIWGVIGPKRVFEGQYPILKYCFLIGCFIPIPFWLAKRFVPKTRKVLMHFEPNVAVIGMISTFAPLNLSYIIGGFYVNWAFMRYIRTRYQKWFEKYTYVLGAALTAGSALAALIIFFAVQYHPKDIDWWGNEVSFAGLDGEGPPLLDLPDVGYFGRAPGDYYY